jgi:hypothetical protein
MLPESIHRRLAFILYLHRQGVGQARHPEPLSAAAILTLHDSVELLLALACEQRNVGAKRMHFDDYFTALDPLFPPNGVAERMSMFNLNSTRVELKHRGTLPSSASINTFAASVSSFFESNLSLMFGVSVAEVSLAHLVSQPDARDALLRVDKAIEQGRLTEAANDLALAFAHILRVHGIRSRAQARHLSVSTWPGDEDLREIGRAVRDLSDGFAGLEQEVGMLRHGVDTRRLEVFRSLTPSVMFAAAGNPLYGGKDVNPTLDDVRYCYDFVIDSALRIQQHDEAMFRLLI